jgi:hypothetical protein
MGSRTDAETRAWQEQSGLEPATGERREILSRLQEAAFQTIKILELEISGIRDGDCYWHGSDVVGGTTQDSYRLVQTPKRFRSRIVVGKTPRNAGRCENPLVGTK